VTVGNESAMHGQLFGKCTSRSCIDQACFACLCGVICPIANGLIDVMRA